MAEVKTDKPDFRTKVVNGLHEPIRDMVVAIDRLERSVAEGNGTAKFALADLLKARDAYVNPLAEAAERGEA